MNDDRKFQERAELMKQLFLVRISPDVIAKVADISEATVTKDRARVAKLYGIQIPTAANSSLERAERFRFLFSYYCKGKYWSNRDPMIRVARLSFNTEKIENYLYSMENLWNYLRMPQISDDYPYAGNYRELLERCHSFEKRDFVEEFYQAVADGVISYDSFRQEGDVIEAATKFFSSDHRKELTSYMITNPKEHFEPLFSILTERERILLSSHYGLDCKKVELNELGEYYDLSRERVRQIIEKAIRKLSVGLDRDFTYLISSDARIDYLEKENQELKEQYNKLSEDTDVKIAKLTTENESLMEKIKEFNLNVEPVPDIEHSAFVNFLIRDIKKCNFSVRTLNLLCANDVRHLVDIVDNWESLKIARNFGYITRREIIDFFEKSRIHIEDFKKEEIALAKRIIERLNL
jgi:hypothetical protein